MKPSQLAEGQELRIEARGIRFRFIRSYSTLSSWVVVLDQHSFCCEDEYNGIQITPTPSLDRDVDAQFDAIISNNEYLKLSVYLASEGE